MAEIEKRIGEGGLWSAVSLSISVSIITLLFAFLIAILKLELNTLDQTLSIILIAFPFAILIHQSKWDENRLVRRIKADTINKIGAERFVLYVGFLLRSWVIASNVSRDHQESMQSHLQAVLKGKDLEADFRTVKLGYSGIIVSTCLILSLPLIFVNSFFSLMEYTLIIFAGSIAWAAIQAFLLLRFLANKVQQVSETVWYYVKYRASDNYMSMFVQDEPNLALSSKLEKNENAERKHLDLIRQLTKKLQPCEKALETTDWPMFKTRLAIVSRWIDYKIERAILFGYARQLHFGSLLREMLDSWRNAVVYRTIDADARFHYLRNMASRLYVIGPAQLRSEKILSDILKLTSEEAKQVEVLIAVGKYWYNLEELVEDYDNQRDADAAEEYYEEYNDGAEAMHAEHEMEIIKGKPNTRVDIDKIDFMAEMLSSGEFKKRGIAEKDW